MARNYDIDDDAFYADPENYQFSGDEIRSLNVRALEDYELRVPMTPAEKRALRKWVASGHSVSESPGSKYICDLGMDFLEDLSLYDKLKIAKITLTNTAPPSIEELEVLMEQDADCDDFDENEYCDLRTIKDKKDLELRLIVPHGMLRKVIYKNGSYVWDIEFPKNMIKGINRKIRKR